MKHPLVNLTLREFDLGLLGEPILVHNDTTRARYVISQALRNRAKDLRKENQLGKAGRLSWSASQISSGRPISKRVMKLIAKDVEIVQNWLVKDA